jgi:hypothetical protein
VAPPIAAPAVAKELPEEESETYDAKTWLADSTKVLSQLNLKSKRLQAEYEEAVALAAEMRAAVESVEAEIDTVRKMREFIAKYRPKVQLHRVRLQ